MSIVVAVARRSPAAPGRSRRPARALVNVEPKSTQTARSRRPAQPAEGRSRSASRSSAVSMPTLKPDQVARAPRASVPATRRVRHPARVLDQRLDAAERLAEGEHLGALAHVEGLLLAAGDPEATRCRRTASSAGRDLVAGVLRQARGRSPAPPRGWPARNSTTCSALSQCRSIRTRERLQAAQRQPGVERARRPRRWRSGGRPTCSARSRSRTTSGAADDVGVPAAVLRRRVHDDVGAEGERLLEVRRGEGVVDDQQGAGVVGDRRERLDVADVRAAGWSASRPRPALVSPGRIAARTASTSETGRGGVLEAPGLRDLVEQPVGAAVRVVGDDHVVAGRAERRAAGCPRRPGRWRTRSPRSPSSSAAMLPSSAVRVGLALRLYS